jgi:CubicO group peptidase (beta-lactamase class C family)
MKHIKIILIIILFPFINCFSQTNPLFITDSLDSYVNRGLQQWQIPGAAVLIVKDGKIVVAKGYGVKEVGTNDKVDENTLFMIGSNTKAFTGTLLALLEQEQKLKLEDKVVKYLPDFKMNDEWINNNLNLIDIITHRMGLETFQGDFMYWSSDLSEEQVIEKFGMIKRKFDFRTKYGYTNAGYSIASKVIHKVSGKEWKDFLKEKILVPLNMNMTTALSVDFAKAENITKPHTIVEDKIYLLPFENIDNMAACGSMGSSVNEISNWIIAQLDSGRLNGQEVIPFKVIQRTREPHTIVRRTRHLFNKTNFRLYGLGWVLEDYEGREIVSHTGGVNGFVTSVTLMPKENLGIAVFTNNDKNSFYQSLKWEIIDSYLGLPYRNFDSVFFSNYLKQKESYDKWLNEVKDSAAMNIKPEINLEEFEGKYKHEVYGAAELKIVNNNLELKLELELSLEHHSKIKGKLEYIGNNRFLCTYSDPTYGIRIFPFDIENGKVKSFDLYVDEFIDYEAYRFVKE